LEDINTTLLVMIGALTNGFAEGFDAKDLRETKALLEELSH
jgi:hypothetical protein